MTNANCIFCKIGRGEIPADIIMEDDQVVIFKDINPKAPVHLLVVPKDHIESAANLTDQDAQIAGRLVVKARAAAENMGILPDGYRLVFNVGKHSGSEVDHLHLHILGGRQLGGMG